MDAIYQILWSLIFWSFETLLGATYVLHIAYMEVYNFLRTRIWFALELILTSN